jgi:hypothetical protein
MSKKTPKYMLYATAGGTMFIAAEELGRKPGRIMVKDAAFIGRPADDVGFTFTPMKWVTMPVLYEAALLLDDELPQEMVPYFEQHQKTMAVAHMSRPKK